MNCNAEDHVMQHLTDDVYRDHEIVVAWCRKCRMFTVDARVDNSDGEFIEGCIDTDLTWCIIQAVKAIDNHELSKINVPL